MGLDGCFTLGFGCAMAGAWVSWVVAMRFMVSSMGPAVVSSMGPAGPRRINAMEFQSLWPSLGFGVCQVGHMPYAGILLHPAPCGWR